MFEPRPTEEPRLVSTSECVVRPGIIQRAWLVELASELCALETAEQWGSGIGDLWALDIAIAQAASPGGMVVLSNGRVGEPDKEKSGIPEELRAPESRDDLAARCEEEGFRTIQWIVAAFDAPEGVLEKGRSNLDVMASAALRALREATLTYAFGDFEKDIVRDALWGADVRERLDRLSLRVLDLAPLEWLSEEFTPRHYGYHFAWDEESSGLPTQARPGQKLPTGRLREFRPRRFSKERRVFDQRVRAIEKNLSGLPRIIGTSWDAPSQSAIALVRSFRTTDPRWMKNSTGASDEWECCVCTNQFLGDDAGDLPVKYLSRAAIPAGHYRIATIHSGQDWVDLVLKYPMVMVPSGTSDWVEEWSGTARGTWVTLDWQKASEDIDGVYLSVLGALDAAYVPLAVSIEEHELWTMMTGWVPGSVLWMNDPLGDAVTHVSAALI